MTEPHCHRRQVLRWIGAGVSIPALAACGASPAEAKTYPVHLTQAQWRKRLSPAAFRVLREAATERPFSSPLLNEHRKGIFVCAGCANHLYSSKDKYDSGTGWPSFTRPIDAAAVGYSVDHKLAYPRREVHCARCGGHLGHVFNDGPPPTGKRYCMNGVAMHFIPS